VAQNKRVGKPGARRSVDAAHAVAGAVVVALAGRRTGPAGLPRLAALALNHAVTNSRMGGTRNRDGLRSPMAPASFSISRPSASRRFGLLCRWRGRRLAGLPPCRCANGSSPNVAALGVFAASLGFAVATLKTSLIDHPVWRFSASGVTVAGFVELREESHHTDRFVVRVDRIELGRVGVKPERIRLSVKRGMAGNATYVTAVKNANATARATGLAAAMTEQVAIQAAKDTCAVLAMLTSFRDARCRFLVHSAAPHRPAARSRRSAHEHSPALVAEAFLT